MKKPERKDIVVYAPARGPVGTMVKDELFKAGPKGFITTTDAESLFSYIERLEKTLELSINTLNITLDLVKILEKKQ